MGVEQEQVALRFLRYAEGRQQDVDGLVGMMTDDCEWLINVPSSKPRIGPEAARRELERQNAMSTGLLSASEIRSVMSNDHQVAVERVDVFEMGDKEIVLRISGVLDIDGDKVSGWREYWDNAVLASQLGLEAAMLAETGERP